MKRVPDLPREHPLFLYYLSKKRESDPFSPLSEEEIKTLRKGYEEELQEKGTPLAKAFPHVEKALDSNYYGQIDAYRSACEFLPDFFLGRLNWIIARLEFFYRIYEDRDGFYENYLDLAQMIEDAYPDLNFASSKIDYFNNYDFYVYAQCLYEAAFNAVAFAHYEVAKKALSKLRGIQKKRYLYEIDRMWTWTLGHLDDEESRAFTEAKAEGDDLAFLCLLLREYREGKLSKVDFRERLKQRSPFLYAYMKAGKWYYQIDFIHGETEEEEQASRVARDNYIFPSLIPENFEEIFKD